MPTLRRRNSNPGAGGRQPLRSSLASAAWAVEDRVVWGAADVFHALLDAVKWPFQRIAWAVEHWLIWPIQEETALWSRPVRGAVLAGVLLLAGAGVAAGIAVSDPSAGGSSAPEPIRVSSSAEAAAKLRADQTGKTGRTAAAAAVAAATAPVLKGSSPDFAPNEGGGGVNRAEAATEAPAAQTAAESAAAVEAGAKSAAPDEAGADSTVAGPAAISVARKFAGAFVLYETGHDTDAVKSVFHHTATPDLARALIKRPPRLPANVKVPEAKVLNIVSGPKHGDTYTLSVSLLRVGVTSELRLDMQKTPAGGGEAGNSSNPSKRSQWLVTDVLG